MELSSSDGVQAPVGPLYCRKKFRLQQQPRLSHRIPNLREAVGLSVYRAAAHVGLRTARTRVGECLSRTRNSGRNTMNSSGIKRGLAATAISALAVTGLPALATSANAAAGQTSSVVSVGPTLNGGTVGGVIAPQDQDTPARGQTLRHRSASPSSPPRTCPARFAEQRQPEHCNRRHPRTLSSTTAPGDSNPTDGLDEILSSSPRRPRRRRPASYADLLDDDGTTALATPPRRVPRSRRRPPAAPPRSASRPSSQSTAAGQPSRRLHRHPHGRCGPHHAAHVGEDSWSRPTRRASRRHVGADDHRLTKSTCFTVPTRWLPPNGTPPSLTLDTSALTAVPNATAKP